MMETKRSHLAAPLRAAADAVGPTLAGTLPLGQGLNPLRWLKGSSAAARAPPVPCQAAKPAFNTAQCPVKQGPPPNRAAAATGGLCSSGLTKALMFKLTDTLFTVLKRSRSNSNPGSTGALEGEGSRIWVSLQSWGDAHRLSAGIWTGPIQTTDPVCCTRPWGSPQDKDSPTRATSSKTPCRRVYTMTLDDE